MKRLVAHLRVFFDKRSGKAEHIEQFVAERGIERSALPLATNGTQERSLNSRTSIFDLNIRELPLSKKETGNTLETRGLTYSYTFLTKPKNAHLECKGTKLI